MRRLGAARFRIWTSHGSAQYQDRAHAFSAARWVANTSDEVVAVANERTGQRWDVSRDGQLIGTEGPLG